VRLLAESSGFGRSSRRATGVLDRWPPSREGYRTRLTVRPRPTKAQFEYEVGPESFLASATKEQLGNT
jgi:hypothetical protein